VRRAGDGDAKLTDAVDALELNDGEGVSPLGRGATLSSGEAPRPEAYKGAGADEMQWDGLLL
jgi:hypothetical protein